MTSWSATYVWCSACQTQHVIPGVSGSTTMAPPTCVLKPEQRSVEDRLAALERRLDEALARKP